MSERAALHVNEGAFARGMHDLQYKLPGIGRDQVEVVVVFAGQRMRGGVETVQGLGQARGFASRDRRSDAGFGHDHGEIVSRDEAKRQMLDSPQRTQSSQRRTEAAWPAEAWRLCALCLCVANWQA